MKFEVMDFCDIVMYNSFSNWHASQHNSALDRRERQRKRDRKGVRETSRESHTHTQRERERERQRRSERDKQRETQRERDIERETDAVIHYHTTQGVIFQLAVWKSLPAPYTTVLAVENLHVITSVYLFDLAENKFMSIFWRLCGLSWRWTDLTFFKLKSEI